LGRVRRRRRAALSCGGSSDTSPTGDPVAAVVVNPPSLTIAVGAQQPLQVQVQDAAGNLIADATVVWSVKDPTVASVSSSGVVTALAVGTTQIAANSNGKSGIATITVNKIPVASVVVRPTHVDAIAGSKTPLTGVAYDAAQNALAGRAISWTSSNQSVATVDANGMVTAVAAGSATITGTSEGKSDVATFTVTQGPVTTVVIVPDSVSMFVTQTTQLAATARDGTGAPVAGTTIVWSSSNTSVASVSPDGVVTAVSAGTATITATGSGHSGTGVVTVTTVPVATVTVSPPSVSVAPGGTATLLATMKDASGNVLPNRAVAWTSSNNSVATVSSTGVVNGVALGTATITATSEGKTGTAS
jgi:Bacterial surface proteins containing Ig-like domains